jgi:hypothetical protein
MAQSRLSLFCSAVLLLQVSVRHPVYSNLPAFLAHWLGAGRTVVGRRGEVSFSSFHKSLVLEHMREALKQPAMPIILFHIVVFVYFGAKLKNGSHTYSCGQSSPFDELFKLIRHAALIYHPGDRSKRSGLEK